MLESKPYRIAVWVLTIALIILVGRHISGVFSPLGVVFRALFTPLIVAGLMYYWFSPVVNWLTRRRFPRALAIAMLYLGLAALVALIVLAVGPVLQNQFTNLVDNWPRLISEIREQLLALQQNEWISRFYQGDPLDFEQIVNQLAQQSSRWLLSFTANLPTLLGSTANFLTIVLIIPFILFYMLLEGYRLPEGLVRFLPMRHRPEVRQVLRDMDAALSAYIQGVIIVSLSVGFMAYIGYTIIGIEYTLLLAVIACVTNIIPFFGPIVGTIPGVLVALVMSPGKALQVLLMIVIVQQIESFLLAPRVMGRKIHTHPVAIILLVIAAGKLGGLVGIILAIPAFAVFKVIATHLYSIFKLYGEEEDDHPREVVPGIIQE
ncbi:MAG TPA: AI-2E family transporter [Bacillota bacterium]|nr:AI-2E family transporter [Bacillota bacterium]